MQIIISYKKLQEILYTLKMNIHQYYLKLSLFNMEEKLNNDVPVSH